MFLLLLGVVVVFLGGSVLFFLGFSYLVVFVGVFCCCCFLVVVGFWCVFLIKHGQDNLNRNYLFLF